MGTEPNFTKIDNLEVRSGDSNDNFRAANFHPGSRLHPMGWKHAIVGTVLGTSANNWSSASIIGAINREFSRLF